MNVEAEPTFGSLFAGIGGIDLGLERAGWECKWQVEINEYASRVLARHWPSVKQYGDIQTVHGVVAHAETDGRNARRARDASEIERGRQSHRDGVESDVAHADSFGRGNADETQEDNNRSNEPRVETGRITSTCCLEPVDLICGGFPCQPVSTAGKRKAQADARWLWPEFARVIREVRSRFVLVENVPGILSVNRGSAFGEVLGDLATLGYDAEWESLPAAAFGAPHLRYRVFIVGIRTGDMAHSRNDGHPSFLRQEGISGPRTEDSRAESCRPGQDVAHARRGGGDGLQSIRLSERGEEAASRGGSQDAMGNAESRRLQEQRFVFQSRAAWSGFERSSWWATEPDVGRVAHGVPSRVDRLKCLGNAVVPQIAEWIGRRIIESWR